MFSTKNKKNIVISEFEGWLHQCFYIMIRFLIDKNDLIDIQHLHLKGIFLLQKVWH